MFEGSFDENTNLVIVMKSSCFSPGIFIIKDLHSSAEKGAYLSVRDSWMSMAER